MCGKTRNFEASSKDIQIGPADFRRFQQFMQDGWLQMVEWDEVLKDLSVLYVEDEPLMRKNLSILLRRRVREIFLAENGEEGLEIFKARSPDVVLTDIEMPVMNGLEMIREIRKISGCPILILTAFNDVEHNSKEASARLIKPIYKEDLLNAIVLSVTEKRDANAGPQGSAAPEE